MTDTAGRSIDFTWSGSHITRVTDSSLDRDLAYAYDESGNLSTVSYPDGSKAKYEYDGGHRITAVTDTAGGTTRYAYADGKVSWITDPEGHSRFTITYSTDGRTATLTNALGQAATYEYDAEGRLTRLSDPAGQEVRHEYDAKGNRIKTIRPQGTWTYCRLRRDRECGCTHSGRWQADPVFAS